jgi:hypothetical protein
VSDVGKRSTGDRSCFVDVPRPRDLHERPEESFPLAPDPCELLDHARLVLRAGSGTPERFAPM